MSTNIDKKWLYVEDEEIIIEKSTKEALLSELYDRGIDATEANIMAVPDTGGTIFL